MNNIIYASVFLSSLFSIGLAFGMEPIEELIMRQSIPIDRMWHAIKSNNYEQLKRALDDGALERCYGRRLHLAQQETMPLFDALQRNNINIVRLLLDNGACSEIEGNLRIGSDARALSYFDYCIKIENYALAKLLYMYGCDTNKHKVVSWMPTWSNPLGSTTEIPVTPIEDIKGLFKAEPLIHCALFDGAQLIEVLKGMDPSPGEEKRALAYAAGRALPGTVEVLLQAGADAIQASQIVKGILRRMLSQDNAVEVLSQAGADPAPASQVVKDILRRLSPDNKEKYSVIYRMLRPPAIHNMLFALRNDATSRFSAMPPELLDELHKFSANPAEHSDAS